MVPFSESYKVSVQLHLGISAVVYSRLAQEVRSAVFGNSNKKKVHRVLTGIVLHSLTARSLRSTTREFSLCRSIESFEKYSEVFESATPKDGLFPQPSALHFLLQTSTIPSGACCVQYSAVFVLAPPNDALLTQPSVLHFLLSTSIIPYEACCAQYSTVLVPETPNDGTLPQPSVLHFLLLTSTILFGACCAYYSVILVPSTSNLATRSSPGLYTLCS